MWCKFGRGRDGGRYNEYTCCFCCHVRMGTVFLGVFNLIRDLLVVTMIAAVSLHPELVTDQSGLVSAYLSGLTGNHTEGVLNSGEEDSNVTAVAAVQRRCSFSCDDNFLPLLLTFGSSLLTVSLLYGVITARPKYILPYFWLQMFDFCIASLTVIGFFSYGPDTEAWLIHHKTFPYRDELLSLGREWLLVLTALTAVLILWLKAYCISVVWSCYKFLIHRISTAQRHDLNLGDDVPVSIVDVGGLPLTRDHISEVQMILPPKYEDLEPLDSTTATAAVERGSALPPPTYESVVMVTSSEGQMSATAAGRTN